MNLTCTWLPYLLYQPSIKTKNYNLPFYLFHCPPCHVLTQKTNHSSFILDPNPCCIYNQFNHSAATINPSNQQTKKHSYHPLHTQQQYMEPFTPEDELFIQKFIGLHTDDNQGPVIQLPAQAATSTNWACSFLAKVITDRQVTDGPFFKMMLRAWNADPGTVFRSLGKNTYLVELCLEEEMSGVFLKGPWTYRGDLVVVKRVSSHLSLNPDQVTHKDIRVQFYDVPINLTDEGLAIMVGVVGTPP